MCKKYIQKSTHPNCYLNLKTKKTTIIINACIMMNALVNTMEIPDTMESQL